MFRSISENPPQPSGKMASEHTKKMITTQYTLGLPEWQRPYQSSTQDNFSKVRGRVPTCVAG